MVKMRQSPLSQPISDFFDYLETILNRDQVIKWRITAEGMMISYGVNNIRDILPYISIEDEKFQMFITAVVDYIYYNKELKFYL